MTISTFIFANMSATGVTAACDAGAAAVNTAALASLSTRCAGPDPVPTDETSRHFRTPFVTTRCTAPLAPACRAQRLFGDAASCLRGSKQGSILAALAAWERGLTNPRTNADPHDVRRNALKNVQLLAREGGLPDSEIRSLVASLKYILVNELNDTARLHAVLALSHIAGPDIIPFLRLHLHFDNQVILEVAIEHAINRIERRAGTARAHLPPDAEQNRSGSQVMALFRNTNNEERIEILRNLMTRWQAGTLSRSDARLLEGWALTIVDHYGYISLYEGREVWRRTQGGIEAQKPPCELYALMFLELIGSKDSAAHFKSWGGLIGPQNDLIVALVEDVGFSIRQRLAARRRVEASARRKS